MKRRDFLQQTMAASALTLPFESRAASSLSASAGWNSGSVAHLLPTMSDRRILLKASFQSQQSKPPRLLIGKRAVIGQIMDTGG